MKLLLTAFEPFGGENVNPALEAVNLVKDRIEYIDIVKLTVPVEFNRSIDVVSEKITEMQPDFVLCVGQAGGRSAITPERAAINIDDARIEDNVGNKPVDEVIFADGETAYFSTLPIKAMVNEIKKAGIPANVSNTAGTYVCNHLMYGVLYTLRKEGRGAKGGFVHVPYIPEQVLDKPDKPSMSLANIVKGLEAAIKAIALNEKDIKEEGGSEF